MKGLTAKLGGLLLWTLLKLSAQIFGWLPIVGVKLKDWRDRAKLVRLSGVKYWEYGAETTVQTALDKARKEWLEGGALPNQNKEVANLEQATGLLETLRKRHA